MRSGDAAYLLSVAGVLHKSLHSFHDARLLDELHQLGVRLQPLHHRTHHGIIHHRTEVHRGNVKEKVEGEGGCRDVSAAQQRRCEEHFNFHTATEVSCRSQGRPQQRPQW